MAKETARYVEGDIEKLGEFLTQFYAGGEPGFRTYCGLDEQDIAIYRDITEDGTMPLNGADLRGLSLSNSTLENVVWDGTNISSVILSDTLIKDSSFVRSHAEGLDLGSSTLKDVVCKGLNAPGALFEDAECTRVDFSGANLMGVNMENIRIMEGCHFDGTILIGAENIDLAAKHFANATKTPEALIAAVMEGKTSEMNAYAYRSALEILLGHNQQPILEEEERITLDETTKATAESALQQLKEQYPVASLPPKERKEAMEIAAAGQLIPALRETIHNTQIPLPPEMRMYIARFVADGNAQLKPRQADRLVLGLASFPLLIPANETSKTGVRNKIASLLREPPVLQPMLEDRQEEGDEASKGKKRPWEEEKEQEKDPGGRG